jgi:hypothetical protein
MNIPAVAVARAQHLDCIEHPTGRNRWIAINAGGEEQSLHCATFDAGKKDARQFIGRQRRAWHVISGAQRTVGAVPFAAIAQQQAEDRQRTPLAIGVGSNCMIVPQCRARRGASLPQEAITRIKARRWRQNGKFVVKVHAVLTCADARLELCPLYNETWTPILSEPWG